MAKKNKPFRDLEPEISRTNRQDLPYQNLMQTNAQATIRHQDKHAAQHEAAKSGTVLPLESFERHIKDHHIRQRGRAQFTWPGQATFRRGNIIDKKE